MSSDLQSILELEVPIIVRVANRDMSMDEVIEWMPGAIIDLCKSSEDELELMVHNVPIGLGRAVKVGENFGIRLTFVGDLKAKIEAMSGRSSLPIEESNDSAPMSNATAEALADEMLAGQ